MSTSQPLKSKTDIEKLKRYFYEKEKWRDYTLITLGLNTALRIGDILQLKWNDVYLPKKNCFKTHITVIEQKTNKENTILLNATVIQALKKYKSTLKNFHIDNFIFLGQKNTKQPISRIQAFRIIRQAVQDLDFQEHISCHSLRKTFGYQAWKSGIEPAMLMNIYNHSSYQITKRYLGIDQTDKDELFFKINL